MRRSILSITAIALMFVFATGASAFDYLYTRDTAMTHDAGTFGVDAAFVYFGHTSAFDHEGESQDFADDVSFKETVIPINIFYSVTDQLEIGIQPKFVMPKYESPGGDEDGSGLGDTWIDAKYMFMPEPMVTARVAFKIPTGDDEPDAGDLGTGEGQSDIDGAILFGVPAGPGMFDAGLGYRYRLTTSADSSRDAGDFTHGSEIHFVAGYTYFLNDAMNLKLAADGYFGAEDDLETARDAVEDSARNGVWISPAFEYMMENGLLLGADFHYPLMGQNIPGGWGVDFFVGWSM